MSPRAGAAELRREISSICREIARSVGFPLPPEFQKAQLAPAALPPRSNYDLRIIFLNAPCFA
jgi:hypothetical protein